MMKTQKYRLFFYITQIGRLPVGFCYAKNVGEAKRLFSIPPGFYIVPYAALSRKAQQWANNELSTCPLYTLGIGAGFSADDIRGVDPHIPIALTVAA